MSIRVGKSAFTSNLRAPASGETEAVQHRPQGSTGNGNPLWTTLLGGVFAGGFYAAVHVIPSQLLQRYFLGHPVAVAATVLFWFAVAVLVAKWMRVTAQRNQLATIRDEDLLPPSAEATPAGRWLEENDAGHVARRWLGDIEKLPAEIGGSHLVGRLSELLTRQSQRGSAKHLADDLRELSARDADASHDSFGLVRIITWAIPMLGFLGTVIGITQTLGGLDFSNGAAAVENLKSGLYVAFDTTAIGLVLSVVAIFLQFPIERSEQRLLAEIDARVGHLLSASLPSDETSDNQTALIADLCRGVQAAVAESLDNQAKLWRETIDEAQNHWQLVQEDNANKIADAIEQVLIPALTHHAQRLTSACASISEQLGDQGDRLRQTLEEAQDSLRQANEDSASRLVRSLESTLVPSLQEHAKTIERSASHSAERLEQRWTDWHESISLHSTTLAAQQQSVIRQFEALAETQRGAESILALQQTLDANLQRLNATNAAIDRSVSAAAGDGMAEAMRFLARAVDVLAKRLPEQASHPHASRHAA